MFTEKARVSMGIHMHMCIYTRGDNFAMETTKTRLV